MANIPNTYTTPTALLEALQQVLPPSYFSTVDGKPRLLIDHLTTSLTPEHSQVNYGLRWQRQPEQCERDSIGKQAVLAYKPEWTVGTPVPNKPPHILIRGDNYYALKALKHTHRSAIDVIYIDPPYNTGNKDFVYNDNFVDAEDGFKHSKWLSFMERRLLLAKDLLKDTGVIFLSIDDDEQSNLKLLCDKIFGPNNFLNTVIWHFGKMSNESRKFANNHEYVLAYGRSPSARIVPSIKKEDTEYKERWKGYVRNNKIYYGDVKHKSDKMLERRVRDHIKKNGGIQDTDVLYDFDIEFKVDSDVIYVPTLKGNAEERESSFGAGQKPLDLMRRLLGAIPGDNLTVLDFFGGSGSTLHATIALNNEDGGSRQCILVTNDEGEFKDATGTPLPGGICTNVTHPRISKVLTGYTNASGKEVPGLPGQLHAFDATLTDPLPSPCWYDHTAAVIKNYGIGLSLAKGFSHIVETTDKHIECATVNGHRLYLLTMQGSFKKIQTHLKSLPFTADDALMAAVAPLWPREHYHWDLPALQANNLHQLPHPAILSPSTVK